MAKGQCNCGAIAFNINSDISEVYMCHCSVCRKSTGNHGMAVIIVENEAFQWVRDEENICAWKKPDEDWETSFCRICGSPLLGINDESRMYVPAGLITDGGESLKVAHHIWVSSKVDWYEIGDSGKQHSESLQS